ncbi:MAG TPA: AMP-binding protein [Candidatus Sulfotelmatobacter sp.]|nr:AMP-binding protein [Candidatus Sulfotelmatobacter sp.]
MLSQACSDRNLGDLIAHASARYGDDVAFQVRRGFRMERMTFQQADRRARQVASWLTALGLVRGDRIAIWSLNQPEYALLYFGAWMAGIAAVPIDVRTGEDVLQRFIAAASPRRVFKSASLPDWFDAGAGRTINLEELFDLVDTAAPLDPLPPIGPDDLADIVFTSGTTGVPKGVMLTHGNLLAQVRALQVAFPLERGYRALSLLPLSHVFEQAIDLLLAYSAGVRITYLPRMNRVTISRALRDERTTCFVIVPELLRVMLDGIERRVIDEGREAAWRRGHRLAARLPFPLRPVLFRQVHEALGGHLIFIGCGSAPLDVGLGLAWERMGIHVFEGYGLSEVAGAASINGWAAHRLGSVGKPLPGVDVRIASDGEILIRGETVMPGYFGNPEQTAQAFTDGWLRTGDIGFFDRDGFLHVAGREAFKIVLADGRKVYPEDVERVLNRHPLVQESCIVGVDGDGGAEMVHAVLVTADPEQAGTIVRAANRELEAHQQIMGYTVWSDADFPRTPILKVDRALVRQAVQQRRTSAASLRASWPGVRLGDPLLGIVQRTAPGWGVEPVETARLGDDLRLDSIGRIELLAAIEEELGVEIDEMRVGPQTTVADLRHMIDEGTDVGGRVLGARWPRSRWAQAARPLLLWAAFRLQDRWMRIEVIHPERVARLPVPALLIFNYQGPYVPLAILRSLPRRLRSRVAIAADARLWQGRDRWQGSLLALAAQAFPFVKSGGPVRGSLEELGRWLDDGYAVIVSPEGGPESEGQLLPFLGGTGLMAVEMQVPVVPFRVDGYHLLFPPPQRISFPYLPNRRGRVRLIVGEPVRFPKEMPYGKATELTRQALAQTH